MIIDAIKETIEMLTHGNIESAELLIKNDYPFIPLQVHRREYTDKQKMQIFLEDGFIDRYSGKRLVNPGILKSISFFCPDEFPYHPHWKMTECHKAYWDLMPTVDHIVPIARGGKDSRENWITTSMLNNAVKSNWTLEELRWNTFSPGNLKIWDGLTKEFIELVNTQPQMLSDAYIKKWYNTSNLFVNILSD